MRSSIVRRLIVMGAILALPVTAYAQEAAISGTVKDATGGVLPGVTVTAVHEASGNTFVAVTDERGAYRIAVRPGVYRITAELPGFTTVIRTGLELLVGQQSVVNLELGVSVVEESVTVTGEAPLIDTTSSTVSGNIDPRQMQQLPIQGRNWMDLSLLAPGSRSNAATEVPQDRQGFFQINVDGQQVTQLICCAQQQPRFSRDAIAEFEVITNRFDALYGRSQGMVVNAITKSGTNVFGGTLSGYFRHDRFNAKDFIQDRVLPYSNQQIVGTFGGPIRKDRIHFFTNYEYEREPRTVTFSSPYPSFNIDLTDTRRQQTGLGKVDAQFTPQSRLSVRYAKYFQLIPNQNAGGASLHPSAAHDIERRSDQLWAVHTQVLSNRAVNQIKGGYSVFNWAVFPKVKWAGGPFPNAQVMDGGSVSVSFSGYTIGTATNMPQDISEYMYGIRDEFTTSFTKWGRHDLKLGGEYLRNRVRNLWCNLCNGVLRSNARPPANIEQLLPVWNDASTWNLTALSPLIINYEQMFGDFNLRTLRQVSAYWVQDDWAMTERLTLNLGLRYDLDIGVQGEKIKALPWLTGDRPSDTNNFGPRLGFAFRLSDRTVLRGGYGKFFTQLENDAAHQSVLAAQTAGPQVLNDGRPDFAANPFNGPAPTYEQVMANACDLTNNRPGCVRRYIQSPAEIPMPGHQISYSHQASIGVQRQLGSTMAVEANYVWTGGRAEESRHNINLTYNPATGANYPFTDISRRPFPDWGVVVGEFMDAWSNYHGLETSFTKRFSNRWQAQATYTLSGFWDVDSPPSIPIIELVNGRPVSRDLPFSVQPDLAGEYTLASTDQRHRATFNGIWDLGYGVQLSGLYFFGSGQRFSTSYGGDRRFLGTTGLQSLRLRPDGTIAPRNNLVGDPIHRVDLRVQKRVRFGGRATIDGMLEVFNLFNHANYGSYTTAESNRNYGRPSYNANVAYQPRMLQLGFRLAF